MRLCKCVWHICMYMCVCVYMYVCMCILICVYVCICECVLRLAQRVAQLICNRRCIFSDMRSPKYNGHTPQTACVLTRIRVDGCIRYEETYRGLGHKRKTSFQQQKSCDNTAVSTYIRHIDTLTHTHTDTLTHTHTLTR